MFSSLLPLLDTKRRELEFARWHFESILQDVAALERVTAMESPPDGPVVPQPTVSSVLSRAERFALREQQVLALFRQYGGTLRLRTIRQALGLSKSAARDWMNGAIDRHPGTCPWTRLNGSRSCFVLREPLPPAESILPFAVASVPTAFIDPFAAPESSDIRPPDGQPEPLPPQS